VDKKAAKGAIKWNWREYGPVTVIALFEFCIMLIRLAGGVVELNSLSMAAVTLVVFNVTVIRYEELCAITADL